MNNELVESIREIIAQGCSCDRHCKKEAPDYCGCRKDAYKAIALIRPATLEEAAKVAIEKETDRIGVPCPDGIKGCAVFHYCEVQRPRTPHEIAAAIRALKDKA